MKVNELMLGDWVIRRGVPEEPMYLYDMKASSNIAYLNQDGRSITEKLENIEPIPLTKEILLKNGFEEFCEGCIIKELSDDEIPTLYIWNGSINFICIVDYCSTNKYTYIKECKYVHEFQHELKSCGIGKEIVL